MARLLLFLAVSLLSLGAARADEDPIGAPFRAEAWDPDFKGRLGQEPVFLTPGWRERIWVPAPPGADDTALEIRHMHGLKVLRPRRQWEIDLEARRFIQGYTERIGLDARNHPASTALLKTLENGTLPVVMHFKDRINRGRAYHHDQDLNPSIQPTPGHPAYPSGHATQAHLLMAVAGLLLPERRDELMAYAQRVAENREIGGVHYRSDTDAGRWLAAQMVAEIVENAGFRDAFAAAWTELVAATGWARGDDAALAALDALLGGQGAITAQARATAIRSWVAEHTRLVPAGAVPAGHAYAPRRVLVEAARAAEGGVRPPADDRIRARLMAEALVRARVNARIVCGHAPAARGSARRCMVEVADGAGVITLHDPVSDRIHRLSDQTAIDSKALLEADPAALVACGRAPGSCAPLPPDGYPDPARLAAMAYTPNAPDKPPVLLASRSRLAGLGGETARLGFLARLAEAYAGLVPPRALFIKGR